MGSPVTDVVTRPPAQVIASVLNEDHGVQAEGARRRAENILRQLHAEGYVLVERATVDLQRPTRMDVMHVTDDPDATLFIWAVKLTIHPLDGTPPIEISAEKKLHFRSALGGRVGIVDDERRLFLQGFGPQVVELLGLGSRDWPAAIAS